MLKPVRTVAPPAADPLITLAQAKAHLRIDHGDDDSVITAMIQAATDELDGIDGCLGRALITQTWRVNFCQWPSWRIRLPLTPVSAITSIKYWDPAGVQQTLAASNYALLEDELSPFADWTDTAVLPSLFSREDAIEVLFVAGYGAAAAVPQAIRQAALIMIGDLYEHRESYMPGDTKGRVDLVERWLLAKFRHVVPADALGSFSYRV